MRAELTDIQHAIRPGWAVVQYGPGPGGGLVAFLITPGTFEVVSLPVSLSDRNVARAIHSLETGLSYGEERLFSELELCHTWFIEPVLNALGGSVKGLYIVPYDALHLVPLHATRSRDGYLCERLPVAYLPTARLLPDLPAPCHGGKILAVGNPEPGTGWSLPFADWEVSQLTTVLGTSRVAAYSGTNATLSAVTGWGDAGLIHAGCHGLADPKFAPFSHLRLADDLLLAHDIVYRTPPVRPGAVVVLAACETGVVDGRAVSEGFGVATAFLRRGAATVLGTSHRVNDLSAAVFAATFSAELARAQCSPAEAYRVARRAVLELTPTARVDLCRSLLQNLKITDLPFEVARVAEGAAEAASRAGRPAEVKEFAELSIRGYEAVRLTKDADRVRLHADLPRPRAGYEHPAHWAAFMLTGRVE